MKIWATEFKQGLMMSFQNAQPQSKKIKKVLQMVLDNHQSRLETAEAVGILNEHVYSIWTEELGMRLSAHWVLRLLSLNQKRI